MGGEGDVAEEAGVAIYAWAVLYSNDVLDDVPKGLDDVEGAVDVEERVEDGLSNGLWERIAGCAWVLKRDDAYRLFPGFRLYNSCRA